MGLETLPEPPANLTAVVRDDVVALTWQPSGSGPAASDFVIEAALGGTTAFAPVAVVTGPSFKATNVPAGNWSVRVRARTSGGTSVPSAPVDLSTRACTLPPGAPADLWASSVAILQNGPGRVTLRFGEPSSGAAEYVIEAGTSAGGADLGRLLIGSQTFFETDVPMGVYYVRARARNACGESAPSNEAVVFVP